MAFRTSWAGAEYEKGQVWLNQRQNGLSELEPFRQSERQAVSLYQFDDFIHRTGKYKVESGQTAEAKPSSASGHPEVQESKTRPVFADGTPGTIP